MAQFPAMPFWTDAYLGDTTHLKTIEHGAYLLLLIAMWRTGKCRLPADDRMLARFAHVTNPQWRRLKPILLPFFEMQNGFITQGRLTDEWSLVREKSNRQSNKARSRWLKNKDTGDAAAYAAGMPPLTLNPTPEERKKVPDAVASKTHQEEFEKETPVDEPPRARLFREGKTILVSMGVSEKQSGAVIGKWLKSTPDCDGVLAALNYAHQNNVIEPIGYVTKLLNGGTNGGRQYGRPNLLDIGRELADEARRLERAAGIKPAPDFKRSH